MPWGLNSVAVFPQVVHPVLFCTSFTYVIVWQHTVLPDAAATMVVADALQPDVFGHTNQVLAKARHVVIPHMGIVGYSLHRFSAIVWTAKKLELAFRST